MKQTFIWQAASNSESIPLDAFYLTNIWHQFEPFQASENRVNILRQKRIHHHQSLIEGEPYVAELKCIDQRTVKHFKQSRYVLTVTKMDQDDIHIEIETTFVTMTESYPKQQPIIKSPDIKAASTLPTQALPLDIEWEEVERYLKTVSDYNPIHWKEDVMPGDFVVMKALEVGVSYHHALNTYRKLDIKYKQMMMKDETLYMQVNTKEEEFLVTVYNAAHQPCIEMKVSI